MDTTTKKIVWIDLEMTGLDPNKDRILEVACVLTDGDLNIIANFGNLVIHQPDWVLESMNEWCLYTHGKTGLTQGSKNSTMTIKYAERLLVRFLKRNGVEPVSACLAGNSIHTDRCFIRKYMKKLDDFLHYRMIDVSSCGELCKYWNKDVYKMRPRKEFLHRGTSDILESIEELKYYKSFMFK